MPDQEAAVTRTLATQEAADSKNLWESEVKSRSKLGLRVRPPPAHSPLIGYLIKNARNVTILCFSP